MARNKSFDQVEFVKDAVNLFWENGYHQTSIQDLVKKLGVNRASLYDTYGDKEGLFKKCLKTYRDDVFTIVKNTINSNGTSKKAFKDLFDWFSNTLINDIDKKGCFICNTYSELLPSLTKNETNELLNETKNIWINTLLNLLKEGEDNNEFKTKIDHYKTAHAIYTSMVGVAILSKTNIDSIILKHTLDIHLQIFN